MFYHEATGKSRLINHTSQNKNTYKSRALSRLSVGQAEGDRYLVGELAQAGRHRVIEFSQMPPIRTVSQALERGAVQHTSWHSSSEEDLMGDRSERLKSTVNEDAHHTTEP